ncbi:MAG TPA: hypothetical protein VGY56_04090 [Verrucomicrobiae bacterium]|nr:hypothetical protein [Verrucomicrobiae bacterium]
MKVKILITSLAVFILTCLFPPWLNVLDIPYHAHQRVQSGHEFILTPPQPQGDRWSVEIDMNTLFVEWAGLAAITGLIWVLIVKPTGLRDDNTNHPKKFISPPGDSRN